MDNTIEIGSVIHDSGIEWVVIAVTHAAIVARNWSGRVASFPLYAPIAASGEWLPLAA